MSVTNSLLKRKISTDAFDVGFAQALCFAGGVLVLALGAYKLSDFDLSSAQILSALLLLSTVSILLIILGVLLPISCAVLKKTSQ